MIGATRTYGLMDSDNRLTLRDTRDYPNAVQTTPSEVYGAKNTAYKL